MESTGSQHLPHLKRTGRSLLLSVPPRASPSLSPFASMLLSINAIFNGFIRRKPSTLHRLPRWVVLAKPWVSSCLSLMGADVLQAPSFCQGASETTDLDADNGSCQAGGGYIPMWLWGKKWKKKREENPIGCDSVPSSSTTEPLLCICAPLYQHSHLLLQSAGGEKHTTFSGSSSPPGLNRQVVQNNRKWIWLRSTLDRVGPRKTDNDL